MGKIVKILNKGLDFIGLQPGVGFRNIGSLGWYLRDLKKLKSLAGNDFPLGKPYPVLDEKNVESGSASGHYFHQDLVVAQLILKNGPKKHVDIGSRIDGFVAHVATFRAIEVIDIRPLNSSHEHIVFRQADLMALPSDLSEYTDSISCLHVIEHFGLGRYGDPIDPQGHLKGLNSIYKMLRKGGKFYFSTPIGPQRINFNAHRVFSVRYLLDLFEGKYTIDGFHYVDDEGKLNRNVSLTVPEMDHNFGCEFGCGIFELTKIA